MISVRKKILILLGIVALALLGGVLYLHNYEREQVALLNESAERQAARTLDGAIRLKGQMMEHFVVDYSFWDELVDFIHEPDHSWADNTLVPSLTTYGVTALWVGDMQGKVVYSTEVQSDKRRFQALPFSSSILPILFKERPFCHFFVKTNAGILEIRGATVHASDDHDRTGSAYGYFFAGRLWDSDFLRAFEKLTATEVTLVDSVMQGKQDTLPVGAVQIRRPLPGWDGGPIAILNAVADKPIVRVQMKNADRKVGLALAFALLIFLVLSIGLLRWIAFPMSAIAGSLRRRDPSLVSGLAASNSEFGELARLISQFFQQKDELQREVLERQRIEAEIRTLNEDLEQRVAGRTRDLQQANQELAREMHERERAEKEIHYSEERYRQLVEQASDGIFLVDCLGRLVDFNSKMNEMLEVTPLELMGNQISHYVEAIHQSSFLTSLLSLQKGHSSTTESVLVNSFGIEMPVEINAKRLDDGRILGFVRDIRERKTLENQREHGISLLRATLESTADGIVVTDLEGNILSHNQKFREMWNLPQDVLDSLDTRSAGRHMVNLVEDIEGFLLRIDELYADTELRATDIVRLKDGRIFERNANPQYLGGACVGRVFSYRDITQRVNTEAALRKAERDYRKIFENAQEGIFQTTVEGKYIRANPRLVEIYGYSSLKEMQAALTDIGHQLYVDPNRREQFMRQISQSGSVTEFESEIYRADGTRIWISENARIIQDENGFIAGYEGTVIDITERKVTEQALLKYTHDLEAARHQLEQQASMLQLQAQDLTRARDEALQAAKMKAEFLANMSHEIRTPLNGVIGMTTVLLDTPLSSEQQEFANTILTSANALLGVINDILDFSKIDAGKMELENVDFCLRGVVEETMDVLAFKAEEKDIELAFQIQPELPVQVAGDPIRLRQILMNLVGNAVKFTQQGEVVVTVSLMEELPEEFLIRFDVRDTGIGIPAEAVPYLFDSFSQVDASSTRKFGGTGLGLAISKQLTEMMGGQIGVESVLNEGSCFWFTARLRKASTQVIPGNPPQTLQGIKVLVVDDNSTNRRILTQILGSWKCTVEEAEGGAEALAALGRATEQGSPFQIALLDMQMPGMDGLQLGKTIKADPVLHACSLVMLTSVGSLSLRNEILAAGFQEYLVKPVKHEPLRWAVARAAMTAGTDKVEGKPAAKAVEHQLSASLRCLVVEDNPVNQKVATRLLTKLGHSVQTAGNGRIAIQILDNERFDLIFMDLQMPEMDGYAATAEIRKRQDAWGGHVPIIAMTAHAIKGDREKCFEAGMDDYVSKPIEMDHLKAAIARQSGSRDEEIREAA